MTTLPCVVESFSHVISCCSGPFTCFILYLFFAYCFTLRSSGYPGRLGICRWRGVSIAVMRMSWHFTSFLLSCGPYGSPDYDGLFRWSCSVTELPVTIRTMQLWRHTLFVVCRVSSFIFSGVWGMLDTNGQCLHNRSMWRVDLHRTVALCALPLSDVKEYVGTTLS
jgi:hypothetical protein